MKKNLEIQQSLQQSNFNEKKNLIQKVEEEKTTKTGVKSMINSYSYTGGSNSPGVDLKKKKEEDDLKKKKEEDALKKKEEDVLKKTQEKKKKEEEGNLKKLEQENIEKQRIEEENKRIEDENQRIEDENKRIEENRRSQQEKEAARQRILDLEREREEMERYQLFQEKEAENRKLEEEKRVKKLKQETKRNKFLEERQNRPEEEIKRENLQKEIQIDSNQHAAIIIRDRKIEYFNNLSELMKEKRNIEPKQLRKVAIQYFFEYWNILKQLFEGGTIEFSSIGGQTLEEEVDQIGFMWEAPLILGLDLSRDFLGKSHFYCSKITCFI